MSPKVTMGSFFLIVGQKIQECLDCKNWSRSHLADELNVSPQIINKIIQGRKNITLEDVKIIADILEIRIKHSFYIKLIKKYENKLFKKIMKK